MKVINLPSTYLQEQVYNNLASYLQNNINDCRDGVLLLPRTLLILSGRIVQYKSIGEAALNGKELLNSFLPNLLKDLCN